ncbi:MAG: MFS transporter, partial [Actinomycetota bacterium]
VASLVYTVPVIAVALGALFIFGMAVPIYAVALGTAAQRFTPPRMQGRVGSTVNMLTDLSQTLSIAIGAALVGSVDYRVLLVIVAVVASLAAVPILMRPETEPILAPSEEPPSDEAGQPENGA